MPAARHCSRSPLRAWAVMAMIGARLPPASPPAYSADRGRGFQPVHFRHLHVHQDHVVAVLLGQVDCLVAVAGDLDRVAPILQDVGGQFLVGGVVFHQQDAQRGTGRRGDSAGASKSAGVPSPRAGGR